jgi:hypothetical protein
MNLENINKNLKRAMRQNGRDALELSPGEVAGFLEICRQSLLDYIGHANERLSADSEAYVPTVELEKIDSIFRELTDNFFPMAHSIEPLRRLQIVDKQEFDHVRNRLLDLSQMARDAHSLSADLSESIGRLINP